MKSSYLLFLFLISLSVARSQTLLNEDFEGSDFPPAGWTLLNGNAPAGYTWARNTDTTLGYVNFKHSPYPAFQGTGSMVYEFDNIVAKAWAITPRLSLTNGASYTITFYYAVYKSAYPEKLKVTVGDAATIEAQNTVLWDNNGGTQLTNDYAWTKATINYTPASSGNFYFGFNCYSDPGMFALMVDDIKIVATPTVPPPCTTLTAPANGAVNITAPQALFSWDSAATATEYTFKLGTTTNPDSIGTLTGKAAYQSGLAYNTTYYWSVIPKNTAGSAQGCPVYSFTTQAAPTVPANDECAGAIEISAGSTISASTRSATQSMAAEACNGAPAGDANDDVWFKFTASQSGSTTITLTPDLIFDGVINAYSGNCGSLVSLACADQGFDGEPETLTLSNLTIGQTYYFRVYGYGNAGKDGSFTLTLSGTTLPVNINNFKGQQNGARNVLSWTTLIEQNNKGFELQRSAEGRNFSTLAFISSKAPNGNSSLALTYQFADVKPLAVKNYYRLKQVDKDGKYVTSDIVLLKGLQPNAFALSNIYPNPAKSSVNVVLTAPVSSAANITITDLAGKLVTHQVAQLTVGNNNLSLDVNKLPGGSYVIKAVMANGNQIKVNKFVKQ